MFENPRRGRQARNFTTNFSKILVLKSSSEQIFLRKYCRWVPLLYMPLQCCKGFAFDSYNNFSKKARKRVTPRMSVQGTTSRKLRHPWAKKSNVSRPDFSEKKKSWRELVFVISDLFIISNSGADLGGGCRGCAPPRWDYLRFSNTTGILQKKKNYVVYWCWSRARDEGTLS